MASRSAALRAGWNGGRRPWLAKALIFLSILLPVATGLLGSILVICPCLAWAAGAAILRRARACTATWLRRAATKVQDPSFWSDLTLYGAHAGALAAIQVARRQAPWDPGRTTAEVVSGALAACAIGATCAWLLCHTSRYGTSTAGFRRLAMCIGAALARRAARWSGGAARPGQRAGLAAACAIGASHCLRVQRAATGTPLVTTGSAALRLAAAVAPVVLMALAPWWLTARRKAVSWVSHPAEVLPCQATLTRAHVKRRRLMAGRRPPGRGSVKH
jgi:hypothetical protein